MARGSHKSKGKKSASKAPANARGAAIDERIRTAQAAWERRDFDEAIRLYERALERAPTHPGLLTDVARAYALRYRFADAEQVVDRASKLHPDDAQLQRMLGRSFHQLQQFDRASECFRRSLELEPDSPHRAETLYELTRIYERLHKLAEARAAAEESLALAPSQPVLGYLLALIDRRAGDKDAAERRLRALIETNLGTRETIADAWYQLAAIRDARGDYDAAHAAATEAKQIFSKISGRYRYDAADISETARRTYARSNAEHFERWHAAGREFKPLGGGLALLASHPRSGTTLLEQILDSHPQLTSADELQVMADLVYLPLCQPHPRETPVPEILDNAPSSLIAEKRTVYFRAMEGALREPIGSRMLLDKNPALTGLVPVIARVFPEMKIIFALRDPRDVVVSCFMQQLPMNPVSVNYLTLESTAEAYAATMHGWLKYRDLIKNPWIQVRYEDVVADLETEARRVLEFLGLPWDDCVLGYRERLRDKHVHSPTYEAVTKPVYKTSIARWRNYAQQLAPCLKTLAPYVEAFGYEA